MKRLEFLVGGCGSLATLTQPIAAGAAVLRDGSRVGPEFFASLPQAKPGLWVRYVMGFSVPYQKQIGFGVEQTPIATRYFIETQLGTPGGSCEPNTLKKAYLKTRTFGNLVQVYGIEAYVSRSNNIITLDEQQPQPLRLLDSPHLYPATPATIAQTGSSTMRVPARSSRQSDESIVEPKIAMPCTECTARFEEPSLKEFELWSAPGIPLGVGRIRALVENQPPFQLAVDSYGFDFNTGIPASLDAVRAQLN